MKKRTQVTCGNCGGVGHNRRACPKQNEAITAMPVKQPMVQPTQQPIAQPLQQIMMPPPPQQQVAPS